MTCYPRYMTCAMLFAMMLTEPCAAQNASSQQSIDPKACSEEQRLRPGDGVSPTRPSDENLSEKLDRTEGVICPPPAIDPQIAVPAPGGGVMPVIPPPGSPGGDPTVHPK